MTEGVYALTLRAPSTEGNFTQSTFGFSVNGEWSGEDNYDF